MLVNADIPGILAFIKMSARDARRSWRYKFNIERFLARALEMFLPPDAGGSMCCDQGKLQADSNACVIDNAAM